MTECKTCPLPDLTASTSAQMPGIIRMRPTLEPASGTPMPSCQLDHLVVTAASLAAGATYVRDSLGVDPQKGGEHVRMGTHNMLLRLGDSTYLEVLAPNPDAPVPAVPRWFGLDSMQPGSAPALAAWVVRTTDIRAAVAAATEPLGVIEPMRRGALDWLITIPVDGVIPIDGLAPALIEWHTPSHPAAGLVNHGLALAGLELRHPDPSRVSRLLRSIGMEGPVTVRESRGDVGPSLVASIRAPSGLRALGAHP